MKLDKNMKVDFFYKTKDKYVQNSTICKHLILSYRELAVCFKNAEKNTCYFKKMYQRQPLVIKLTYD